MNAKTLEKIKKELLSRKEKIEKELIKFTEGDNKKVDVIFPQFGDKSDENAAEIATYTDNLSLETSLQNSLRDIDKALKRIKKGDYGICTYCGKSINEKRLLARPVSSACIKCKNKLSKT